MYAVNPDKASGTGLFDLEIQWRDIGRYGDVTVVRFNDGAAFDSFTGPLRMDLCVEMVPDGDPCDQGQNTQSQTVSSDGFI